MRNLEFDYTSIASILCYNRKLMYFYNFFSSVSKEYAINKSIRLHNSNVLFKYCGLESKNNGLLYLQSQLLDESAIIPLIVFFVIIVSCLVYSKINTKKNINPDDNDKIQCIKKKKNDEEKKNQIKVKNKTTFRIFDSRTIKRLRGNKFLFEELVSRDFKQKYKRTVLGMLWSILYPLLNLLVMSLVFKKIFGRNTPHYTIYLFCGTLIMSFFRESTKNGMNSLVSNKNIINKINVPKYLFLFSNNVSSLINFGLTLTVFIMFCIIDNIHFHWGFIALIFPIVCLVIFNVGMGLILSAMYVFFKDTSYLYDIFLTLLNYLSVIFYKIDIFSKEVQRLFMLNPIYCYIKYFRLVVIEGVIPSLSYHLLCAFYALTIFSIGAYIYKKYNHKFLYYM